MSRIAPAHKPKVYVLAPFVIVHERGDSIREKHYIMQRCTDMLVSQEIDVIAWILKERKDLWPLDTEGTEPPMNGTREKPSPSSIETGRRERTQTRSSNWEGG